MPNWKKLIVSGSDATLNSLNVTTSLTAPSITGSLQGTSSNVTGTVAISNGGTGATTAAGARTNLEVENVVNLTVNTARTTAAKTTVESVTFEDGTVYNVNFTLGTAVTNATLNGVNIQLGTTNVSTTTLSTGTSAVVIPMRYNSSTNKLNIYGSYRTSDSTDSFRQRWNTSVMVGATTTREKILMRAADGKWYPIISHTTDSVATNKTISQQPFLLGDTIIYSQTTTTIQDGSLRNTTNNYAEIIIGGDQVRRNFNQHSGWTAHRAVYLKGTIDSNGMFVLDNTTFTSYMTQTLPTTDDGFVYVQYGIMRDTTLSFFLYHDHAVYQYKDGAVRLYSGFAESAAKLTTARTIGGVSFNGTANINLPGVNTAGNQNTTGTSSNVTGTVAISNGGTGATTAAAARTNLGATTIGGNLFTLTNPSAITFLRVNANNTVDTLNAANFRTAIGAGTSSTTGTVTSIATNNGITGGTITTSGTIGLTGQALALHNLATNGLIARTGTGTVAGRTLTGTANQITVTNGNGVSGNPTLSTPQNIHTAATPTFGGLTINGNISLRAAATATTPTQIPVFIANPASTTRILVTRTPAQLRGDIGAEASFTKGNLVQGTGTTLTGTLTSRLVGTGNVTIAVDNTVVRTSGNQTLGGIKTFSSTIAGSITGNAGTATTLQTARLIGGVSFNGSANINLPGVNTTGTQDTSGNAASSTVLQTPRTLTIGDTGKTFNGSTNVAWSLSEIGAQASLTNPVTGTGTNNFLPKFTSTGSTLGNSQIFDNGTNVGIGTATPDTTLDVNGDVTITNKIIHKGDTDTFFHFRDNNIIEINAGGQQQIRVTDDEGGRTLIKKQLHAGVVPLANATYELGDGVSSVIADDSFGGDFQASGTILSRQDAGVNGITRGMLLFLSDSGTWDIANATSDATSTSLLGYALNNASSNDGIDVLIEGIIYLKSFHRQMGNPVTPGAPLYIRAVNGTVDEDAPTGGGNIVRLIGHNITGVSGRGAYAVIRFKPDNTWIEL